MASFSFSSSDASPTPTFFDGSIVSVEIGQHMKKNIIAACEQSGISIPSPARRKMAAIFNHIGLASESRQRMLRTKLMSCIPTKKRASQEGSLEGPSNRSVAHADSPVCCNLSTVAGSSQKKRRTEVLSQENSTPHQPCLLPSTGIATNDTLKKPVGLGDSFMELPSRSDLHGLIAAYIDRTGNEALRSTICAVCAREQPKNLMSPYNVSDIPNRHLLTPDVYHPAHKLTGGCLLYANAVNTSGETSLCRGCENKLESNKLPPLSLANGMWIGDIPIELAILTLPERLLIAKYFPLAYIVKLFPRDKNATSWGSSTMHRGLKGNVSTYHLDSSSISDMIKGHLMPRPASILPAIIGVTFVGFEHAPSGPLPEFLSVRRGRVRDALCWLKKNNPLYADIEISEEHLANLPVCSVPEEIIQTTRISDDAGALDREHDGYVPEELLEGEKRVEGFNDENYTHMSDGHDSTAYLQNPSQNLRKHTANVVPLQAMGVVDVRGDEVPERELLAHALHNLSARNSGNHDESYVVKKGGAFVNEYARVDPVTKQRFDGGPSDPNHLLGAFPVLFPYGLGGFEVKRKENVSYEAHARWTLEYADKRFRKDFSFVFQVFGVIQKRNICRSASLQVGRDSFARLQPRLRQLKPSDFVEASKEEARGQRFSNPTIQCLRSHIRAVRVRVEGTDESRNAIRGKIWGTIMMHSPPSLWITLNPADTLDPVAQVIAGADIDLDNFFKTAGPTALERSANICADPYAASKYFHTIIHIVLEELFGIKAGQGRRRIDRKPGIVGMVRGYIGTVEAQMRGSLHLHMVMWLVDAPTSEEMKTTLLDPSFQGRVRSFISSVIKADLDGADDTAVTSIKPIKEASYARPVDPRKPNFDQAAKERERDLARTLQLHQCDKHRCLKVIGNRLVCKRRAPFPTSSADWINTDGMWGPRRLCAFLNNWNSLLLICLSCNHDIKLLTNGAETKAITWYITTYATKKQTGNSNVSALLSKRLAFHHQQELTAKASAHDDANKRLLQRCSNSLGTLQQFSAPEVMGYLMGWGDRFESHHFVNIHWDSAVKTLKSTFPEVQEQSPLNKAAQEANVFYHEEALVNSQGESNTERLAFEDDQLTIKSQLKDYMYRGDGLEDLNFLDFMLNTYDGDMLSQHEGTSYEFPAFSTRRHGRPPNQRYPYKPELGRPHKCRILRTEGHETLPHFSGQWFPRNDDESIRELYCASILLLLNPWRRIDKLKHGFESFNTCFQEFMASASHRITSIMDNIQYYHEAMRGASTRQVVSPPDESGGDTHQNSIDEENPIAHLLPNVLDVDEYPSPDISLEAFISSITEQDIEAARNSREQSRETQYGLEAVSNAENAGIFTSIPVPSVLRDYAPTASFESVALYKEWESELRAFTREDGAQESDIDDSSDVDSVPVSQSTVVPSENPCMPLAQASIASLAPAEDKAFILEEQLRCRIDQKRIQQLNEEQLLAYKIIENRLLDSLVGRSSDQLLMLVLGPGGTGKSLLIKTITETFKDLGASRLLAKTASSGIAASLIGGQTMHGWAGIPIRPAPDYDWEAKSSKKTSTNRKRNISGRTFLLHDELSMTTKDNLACLSQCTSLVHVGTPNYHSTKPFGGMNVVMFGDFHQFPPVGNQTGAMYCDRPETDSKRALVGREIYLQFTDVVILKEQKRVTDPRWHTILQNLRTGDCTSDDISVLQDLVLSVGSPLPVPDFDCPPWSDAVLVTPRHAARQLWNTAAVKKHSMLSGHRVYLSPAEDTHASGLPLDNHKRWLVAGMKQKATGKLPDLVEIAIGMKAMVVTNIATEADLSNGTRGRIVSIQLDPRETATREQTSGTIQLRFPPILVVLKPDTPSSCRFQGLQDGLLPISPTEVTFSLQWKGEKVPVRRRQLAVTPGYAFTDYKSQGQTIEAAVIDLAKPPSGAITAFNAYVALSRSRSRATTRFIRPFDTNLLTMHPSTDLRSEDERLEAAAVATQAKYSGI